jgi:hypothetical protein
MCIVNQSDLQLPTLIRGSLPASAFRGFSVFTAIFALQNVVLKLRLLHAARLWLVVKSLAARPRDAVQLLVSRLGSSNTTSVRGPRV